MTPLPAVLFLPADGVFSRTDCATIADLVAKGWTIVYVNNWVSAPILKATA